MQSDDTAGAAAHAPESSAAATRFYLLCLAAYVLTFFALRVLISSTIGVDDVEQVIYAQDWRWGYNPGQPPLYTWLTLLALKLTGGSHVAPQLVRYALLTLTFVFLYRCAQRTIQDPWLAVLATFATLLIYFVGWGAHQGFTHTALVAAATSATLCALLRVIAAATWANYVLLGLALGFGLQSKYNFLLIALALMLAALADSQARKRILNTRFLVSTTIAVAMVVPAWLWLLGHYDLRGVLRGYLSYQRHEEVAQGFGPLTAAWSVVRASLSFLASFVALSMLLFPQGWLPWSRRIQAMPIAGAGSLLGRFFLIVYALLFTGVLTGVLEHVKIRYLYPILILFPVYFFCRVERAGYSIRQVRYQTVVLVAFVLLTAILWLMQPLKDVLCGRCRLFEPYPALAEEIAASGFVHGLLLAEDEHIGGNLRIQFPEARLVSLHYPHYVPAAREEDTECLIVWNTKNGDAVPAALADPLRTLTGYTVSGSERVDYAEGFNRANRRPLRLGYTLIDWCTHH